MDNGNLGAERLLQRLDSVRLSDTSPDPFFGHKGVDYFWRKEDLENYVGQIYVDSDYYTVCSYDLRQEIGHEQMKIPSKTVYFWCQPSNYICSPSTPECLKINGFWSSEQVWNILELFSQTPHVLLTLFISTLVLLFLTRGFHLGSLVTVIYNYASRFRRKRIFTPMDRNLNWIILKLLQLDVRWNKKQLPLSQLEPEDLIAVLRKMEIQPFAKYRLSCKLANSFCQKHRRQLAPDKFDLLLRIIH